MTNEKQEFNSAHLRKIKPESLIENDVSSPVSEFDRLFLSLGLIFNDLKGLIIFDQCLENFRIPEPFEVSGHAGEFYGLKWQLFRLASSHIHEFVIFLQKNKGLLLSDRFLAYENELTQQDKDIWYLLLSIAGIKEGQFKNDDLKNFQELLLLIRNNITFHYKQLGKPLASGFKELFYSDEYAGYDNSKYAYFYLSKTTINDVRFYYADAAIEGYLRMHMKDLGDGKKVIELIYSLLAKILKVIIGLQEQYLSEKPAG